MPQRILHILAAQRVHIYVDAYACGRINFIKSPASEAGKVNYPRLMSQVKRVCELVWAYVNAVRMEDVPVVFCLLNSCCHVTEVGRPYGL